jgi:hypothetical protein
MGGTGAADLAFEGGDLWVLVFGDEAVGHRMEVVRVDPESGGVLARVPLNAGLGALDRRRRWTAGRPGGR